MKIGVTLGVTSSVKRRPFSHVTRRQGTGDLSWGFPSPVDPYHPLENGDKGLSGSMALLSPLLYPLTAVSPPTRHQNRPPSIPPRFVCLLATVRAARYEHTLETGALIW